MKKTIKIERPVFYHKGNKDKELKAGGIIFYKDKKLLLINSNNKIEDFGGKTEPKDKNIYDTVAREVEEESNRIFNFNDIRNKIEDENYIYIPWSKYALFFIELDKYYDIKIFGNKEEYENINRTVEWVTLDEFLSRKKNFRLIGKSVRYKIKDILSSKKIIYKKNIHIKNNLFLQKSSDKKLKKKISKEKYCLQIFLNNLSKEKYINFYPEFEKIIDKIDTKFNILQKEIKNIDGKMTKFYTDKRKFFSKLNKLDMSILCNKIIVDSYFNNYDIKKISIINLKNIIKNKHFYSFTENYLLSD